jgi:hypothetical protein
MFEWPYVVHNGGGFATHAAVGLTVEYRSAGSLPLWAVVVSPGLSLLACLLLDTAMSGAVSGAMGDDLGTADSSTMVGW